MQLTAHYLSHSLLASILICEREREVSDRGQGGMKRGRQTGSEKRESWHRERLDKGERRDRDKYREEDGGRARDNLT